MTAPPSSKRVWLASYVLLYAALAGVVLLALWQACGRPVWVEEPPGAVVSNGSAAPRDVEGRLDPNVAAWHELANLPGLGESLAQRIVAHRKAKQLEWQQAHPERSLGEAPPVFVAPQDLLPVKGIGPKKLEGLRPYLRWPATADKARG